MTLACEDANSKLVDVVTVADDDRLGNSLLHTVVATKNATLSNIFFLHSATVFFVDFISQKNDNM